MAVETAGSSCFRPQPDRRRAMALNSPLQMRVRFGKMRLRTPLVVLTVAVLAWPLGTTAGAGQRYSLRECVNRVLIANRDLATVHDQITDRRFTLDTTASEFDLKFIPLGRVDLAGQTDTELKEEFAAGMGVEKKLPFGTRVALTPQVNRLQGDEGEEYRSVIGLSIDQPLLRGLGRPAAMASVYGAEYQLRSARRGYYKAQIDKALQAVRAVYIRVRLQRQIEIQQESVNRLARAAASARVKRQIGIADAEDVFRAEEKLKQNQSELIASQKALARQDDELRTLMNLSQDAVFAVDAPGLELNALPDEKTVRRLALANRIEIAQAEDDIREQYRLSRLAEHNILPELNVVLGYQHAETAQSLGASFPFDRPGSWTLSLVSNTDVARTAERNTFAQSLQRIEAAKRDLVSTRETVVKEVKDALRTLLESRETIQLQAKRIEGAARQVSLSRLKFKHGLASNFDLLDAEQVMKTAQLNHLNATTNHIIATYALQRAMGVLFEKRLPPPETLEAQ
jgi:outer membrane protein